MNEAEVLFNQMEDIDCELTVYQNDGVTALDMSDLSTNVYVLLHDGYRNIVAKYKKGSASAGWYLIDAAGLATGLLAFKVFSEVTKPLKPGKYYFEITVRLTSGVHTDDYLYDVVEVKQYAFTIKESLITKLVSLP